MIQKSWWPLAVLPFPLCRWWRAFSASRGFLQGHLHNVLLAPTDCWSAAWIRVHYFVSCWHSSLGARTLGPNFVRPLRINRRSWRLPCNGVYRYRPRRYISVRACPLLGIPVHDGAWTPHLRNSRAMGLLFEAVLPEWFYPMTSTIATWVDHVQIKVISPPPPPQKKKKKEI